MSNARRIRVLELIKTLDAGGAERLLVDRLRVADREHIEYAVGYLESRRSHLVGVLRDLGVPIHCLGRQVQSWMPALWRLLREAAPSILHVHSPIVAVGARLLTPLVQPRPVLIYTEHSARASHRLPTRLADRLTDGLDDVILAASRATRDELVDPVRRSRAIAVVHGVDPVLVRHWRAQRSATRSALGVSDDALLIVTVANVRVQKNYPGLLAAARLVLSRFDNVRFVAVGDGELRPAMEKRAHQLGLGAAFRFVGHLPDAARVTAAADLFVLASHHEGLPVAVMEAMTLGVPIVAPAVGGLPEMVEDDAGILVAPDDPAKLADAIGQLVVAADLRARLGARAAERASRYDIRETSRVIEGIYRAAVGVRAGQTSELRPPTLETPTR